MADEKPIHIQYYALLREERGLSSETCLTTAETSAQLYDALQQQHGFRLQRHQLKVAINDAFGAWDTPLNPNDTVVFIPPVAGG